MRALPWPPLLVITDRRLATRPLTGVVETVLSAGCRWILVREKDLDRLARRRLVDAILALARPVAATVLVNGDVDVALESGADGVHLPADRSVAAARAALGQGRTVGYSAHDLPEAEAAARAGADYVTLSPIFATASKPGYGPALGLERLRSVAAAVPVPIMALGGIDAANGAACLRAGAGGLAVMGAAMADDERGSQIRALVALWPAHRPFGSRAPLV